MSSLHCPVCHRDGEPATQVATVAICQFCGSSVNVDAAGTVRRATAQDTAGLSITDLKILRTARATTRKE